MIWLFPILFIIHDLEEIIGLIPWIKRHSAELQERFPKLTPMLDSFTALTPSSFCLGVVEELLIILAATLMSSLTGNYRLWLGLFVAYMVHLVIHMVQALALRRYIPALLTSTLCLPISMVILLRYLPLYPWGTVLLYSAIGFIFMLGNLYVVHKLMGSFARWCKRKEGKAPFS